VRCHFLAPLKPPDAAVPSGDRTIVRNLMTALGRLGFDVHLASRLRTRLATGAPEEMAALAEAAAAQLARILARERTGDLVFTYHVYHRAPDLIGPPLARQLGVPYVVAEASRAPKQAAGPFAAGYHLAGEAIDAAKLVFAATRRDRVMLERMRPPGQHIVDLHPFLDLAQWPPPDRTAAEEEEADRRVRLLTVAMMRPGNKAASYARLAAALPALAPGTFTLDIVGDGAARAEVMARFAPFGDAVRFHGRIDEPARLRALYASADLFVWPAVNEPFGVVFLEAQSQGVPCLAAGHGGVADAIRDGETGRVVPPGDEPAFAAALREIVADHDLRRRWSVAAVDFVASSRSLDRAVAIIGKALADIGVRAPAMAP
jgi:glycosyltransferase involved in cell wall biosynthesis